MKFVEIQPTTEIADIREELERADVLACGPHPSPGNSPSPKFSLVYRRMLLTKATRRSWFVCSKAAADPWGVAPHSVTITARHPQTREGTRDWPCSGVAPGHGRCHLPATQLWGQVRLCFQKASGMLKHGLCSWGAHTFSKTPAPRKSKRAPSTALQQLAPPATSIIRWPRTVLATGIGDYIQERKGRKYDFAGSSLSKRAGSWRAGRMLVAHTLPFSVLVCLKHSNCCSSLLEGAAPSQCEGWFVSF